MLFRASFVSCSLSRLCHGSEGSISVSPHRPRISATRATDTQSTVKPSQKYVSMELRKGGPMAERTATHADSAGHILRQVLYRVVWRIRGCRRHRRCRVQRSFVLVPARNGGRAPLFAAPRRMGTAFLATYFGSKSQFLSWASWAAPYLIPCPIVKFVMSFGACAGTVAWAQALPVGARFWSRLSLPWRRTCAYLFG